MSSEPPYPVPTGARRNCPPAHGGVGATGIPAGRPRDLTGNVLFHPTRAPAVIDTSPYWRPVGYAEGVVVADALCWHGANAGLLDVAGVSVPAVARALLFRMATTNERVGSGPPTADLLVEAEQYEFVAAAISL